MTSPSSGGSPARGIVRLLNTADGRVLCLAGDVDGTAVDSFKRRYGPEPARVDGIDAGSATSLSTPALELVRDHLEAARRAGLPVALRRWPAGDRWPGRCDPRQGTPGPGGQPPR